MRQLLRWYQHHKRQLPWRETRDGYCLFISEIMLQQTQVDRVVPKYNAWLKRFPNWKTLANANTSDLIHAWAGLGYNRRALQTREAAQYVIANSEPNTETEWRLLKGVGPYTAAALTEFVQHTRTIVIDTNIRRVAGRYFLGVAYPKIVHDRKITKSLEPIVKKCTKHWELPQAMMDLASSICTSNTPACLQCPLKASCAAAQNFLSTKPPRKPKARTAYESRHRNKPYPDRIYRGRILQWIRTHGPTPINKIGPHVDKTYQPRRDLAWVRAMIQRLNKDGLVSIDHQTVSLPPT